MRIHMIVYKYPAINDEKTSIHIKKIGRPTKTFLGDSLYWVIWKSESHLTILSSKKHSEGKLRNF